LAVRANEVDGGAVAAAVNAGASDDSKVLAVVAVRSDGAWGRNLAVLSRKVDEGTVAAAINAGARGSASALAHVTVRANGAIGRNLAAQTLEVCAVALASAVLEGARARYNPAVDTHVATGVGCTGGRQAIVRIQIAADCA